MLPCLSRCASYKVGTGEDAAGRGRRGHRPAGRRGPGHGGRQPAGDVGRVRFRLVEGRSRQSDPGADDRADERGRAGAEPARAGDCGSRGPAERPGGQQQVRRLSDRRPDRVSEHSTRPEARSGEQGRRRGPRGRGRRPGRGPRPGCQGQAAASYLRHVQHGYATTCHGTQGATYDQTFVVGGGSREWTYTALSRHRVDTHMYLSSGQSDDGELDLPRQIRDALGTARRAAAGSEAKPAAVELAPRTQSDAELRAEIEHTAETLRTRPAYAKAMPDADERLAKRSEWDAEHAPDLARGVEAGDELGWRQQALRVAQKAEAPEVKAPTIGRDGPVLERSA